ncbi:MAG: cyclic pyranopterin monophosphate synthase MoaC [Bacteroidetes bacterium HGW-Bacteroidetes-10]|jgi:cyclic pyranopterin phosphate synthase|nr:MAG: cyclic pyranopterin monophosphate synthase MoaC [Bacteroidetes bacterium HGW-Bacteroidetes-10]
MATNKSFSHTDEKGRANMVDVGEKPVSKRVARAAGHISLSEETVELIRENGLKKGDLLSVAQIAGIMAAKKTSDLIPLCHQLLLNKADVKLTLFPGGISAESYVSCNGNTGVEMEALTAVSVALLTVYDMCKAVDKKMVISKIELLEKTKSRI